MYKYLTTFDLHDLKTGDLLLFNNQNTSGFFGFLSSLIKWGSHSNYTHIAMVLKNPTFINPNLKGTYVWESSWEGTPDPQDGKTKLGVQITPIHEILNDYKNNGKVLLRRLNGVDDNTFADDKMRDIHNVAYDKPYDIIPTDWIGAMFKKDSNPQKTSRFWCSALVGYIYTKLNILECDTDWSVLAPNDFSLSGENLNFVKPYSLDKEEIRID